MRKGYWGIGSSGAHADSRSVDLVAAFEDDGFVPMGLLQLYGLSVEALALTVPRMLRQCSTPPWSTPAGRSRVGWIALIGVGDPMLLAVTPLAGFLVAYFGSPLLQAWLWGASFIRPSFSPAH